MQQAIAHCHAHTSTTPLLLRTGTRDGNLIHRSASSRPAAQHSNQPFGEVAPVAASATDAARASRAAAAELSTDHDPSSLSLRSGGSSSALHPANRQDLPPSDEDVLDALPNTGGPSKTAGRVLPTGASDNGLRSAGGVKLNLLPIMKAARRKLEVTTVTSMLC